MRDLVGKYMVLLYFAKINLHVNVCKYLHLNNGCNNRCIISAACFFIMASALAS